MMSPEAQTRTRGYGPLLLVALLCLIWSSTWWGIRICLREHPPLSSAAVRFLIAGVAMALVAPWLQKRERLPSPPAWLWMTTGLTNFAVGYGILYVAETVVPSGIAAVLWAIFPLLMAGSAACFLGERLRPLQWVGFALSFLGIVVVSSGDKGGIAPEDHGHVWLLLASPLIATVGLTLVKKHGSGTSSAALNRNSMLFGAVLLAVAAFVHEDPAAMTWTTSTVVATTYLAIAGTTMTFGIYFWLLRTAPASMLALINYVTPILAMVFGELVGDGSIDLLGWLGAAAVVGGIALALRKPRS